MATSKISTTERNKKIAIWVEHEVAGRWNVWDVSKKPTMKELLKAVAHAYELGARHEQMRISRVIDRSDSDIVEIEQ